ncbi:probable (S)-N-methylcoclaurine 3'-hydroxylase isozyme 2 [Durio zibethinus]|uniref:Probable (S)-N-methylcoclaurine 3'-hydroxylase isozyme 2 n=1 Tax=Durio zibethinus TaxID=66656 RepID=A0A6P5XLH0_DURZI|nr:probable (S)-N-methylcoclaurine 3'-hydroxylase isozyme 2 [Durio zibethinus]
MDLLNSFIVGFGAYLSGSMILAVTLSIASYFVIPKLLGGHPKNWKNAPPGPAGWPILGSLPHLSHRLHEDFFHLALIYGPLFSLNMGIKPAIVVSSPEMAALFLKEKEGMFSSRTITEAILVVTYDAHSIIFSPYGPRWKALRKILITELLSPKAFEQFEPLRTKQVHGLLKYLYLISKSNTQVNIAESAFTALANLVSNILCSKSLFDNSKPEGKKMKEMFWEMIKVLGTPNFADLIPIVKPFDPQGFKRKVRNIFDQLDAFYEKLIEERLAERKGQLETTANNEKMDMLDVLLSYRSNDKENGLDRFSRFIIKGMLSEMFIAGTETTSSTVEWGMTEILRKPRIHKKLLLELDQVVGKNRFVVESDLPNLPYLQATVKEVFRLHPGVPLILPRRANEACEVAGYHIPKHCIVYVNIWGMARDPKEWENPLEFKPERFIGSSVDVKGQDFNLLPFGTGRRSCVGWPLAHRMVHYYLAAFLHAFEWDSPPEILNDMNERVGLTLQKDKSLLSIPKPRLPASVYEL